MLEISNSFDNTTSAWPDDMNNLITGLGEWTLTEAFYREQLATLPLMAITQLQAFNRGLIQAITNNIDPSTVNIHGHSNSTTHSGEWLGHQSPFILDLWNHWAQHSEEIVAMPPFLDITDPNPIVIPSSHPGESTPLQNVQHTSLGGAPMQNLQAIMTTYARSLYG